MTERNQQRLVNHRLAVVRHAEGVTGNVAQTWRDVSTSPPLSTPCFDEQSVVVKPLS